MSNVFAVTLLLDCGHKIKVPYNAAKSAGSESAGSE